MRKVEGARKARVARPTVGSDVFLGEGERIDPGVILGYKTGRKIADFSLRIGANAVVRAGTVIYGGTTIGDDLATGHHVVIREENRIGDHFQVWNGTTIDYGCVIGNGVKIHANCYIAQFTTIEDEAFLAPGVTVANDIHPGCAHSAECMKGPTIGRKVQIGVNVTLVPYITIGEGSLIAAGAVVTKDVPPASLVVGNPGRVVKSVYDLGCPTGITDQAYHRIDWLPR